MKIGNKKARYADAFIGHQGLNFKIKFNDLILVVLFSFFCVASFAEPIAYIAEVKGQTAEFDNYQEAHDFVLSLYPTSYPTSQVSGKANESIYFFSDYCFANDRGWNAYGYSWGGSNNPQYCGFSSAQAIVNWIVPDSRDRRDQNPRMNVAFSAASLGSGFRVTTSDYILILAVDGSPNDVREDRVIVKGESAKITTKNICYAPYSFDESQVIGTYLKTGCLKYCPPENPILENGICTGPKNTKEPIQQCAGNPVLISNGTKVQYEAPDIKGTGTFPLNFSRNYNSQRSLEAQELHQITIQTLPPEQKLTWTKYVQPADYTGLESQFEMLVPPQLDGVSVAGFKNWSHNYSGQLESFNSDASVRLTSSAFANRAFNKQADGSYKADNLTSDTLTRIEDGTGNLVQWIYRSVDNQFEYYNEQGLLTRRVNRAGLSHYLEYDGNNNLAVVKDDHNNQLLFTYDDKGKRLTLSNVNGEWITYGYDQYANLSSVTKRMGSGKETVRRYHYEDPRHPYALTGITDENNVRYATWEYDAFGRAVVSKHANDTDKTTFAFEANQTTVTNPLGKQTIYNYNTIAGAKRLETVEGVGTANCLGANQNYEYYPDGQLKSKTDWKGVTTEFVYNERSLEIQRTEAVGSPQQRIISTTWHPIFNLTTSVTIGNQITIYDYDANGLLTAKSIAKI